MKSLIDLDNRAMHKIMKFSGKNIWSVLRSVSKRCCELVPVGQFVFTSPDYSARDIGLRKRLLSTLNINTIVSLNDNLETLSEIIADGKHFPKRVFLDGFGSFDYWFQFQKLLTSEKFTQLETLSLCDWKSGSEAVIRVVETAGYCVERLMNLRLDFSSISPGHLAKMFHLGAFPRLKTLDITAGDGRLSVEDITALGHLKLKHLSLNGCSIGREHFDEMKRLSLLSHVKSLHLERCVSMDQSGVSLFFETLHEKISNIFISAFSNEEGLLSFLDQLEYRGERWPLLKKVTLRRHRLMSESKTVLTRVSSLNRHSDLELDYSDATNLYLPVRYFPGRRLETDTRDLPYCYRTRFRHGLKYYSPSISPHKPTNLMVTILSDLTGFIITIFAILVFSVVLYLLFGGLYQLAGLFLNIFQYCIRWLFKYVE